LFTKGEWKKKKKKPPPAFLWAKRAFSFIGRNVT